MSGQLIDAGQGTAQTGTTTPASFTVTFATGTGTPGVGDYIIVAVTLRGTAASCTITTPTGWTLIDDHANTTSGVNRIALYGRIRQAGDAGSVTFTTTSGGANDSFIAQAYYFGGIDAINPNDVAPTWTDSSATSATLAGPLTQITTAANKDIAVAFWHRADDAGTFSTASSGWTLPSITGMQNVTISGTDAAMGIAYKKMPTAGATGTFQLDVTTGAAAHWTGCILGLKKQPGAGLIGVTCEAGVPTVAVVAQTVAEPNISIVTPSTTATTYQSGSPLLGLPGGIFIRHVVAASQQRFKINCDIPDETQFGMTYFRTSAYPSTSTRITSLEAWDGTDHAQVQMSSTGTLRVTNAGGAITSAVSAIIPLNTWCRIEWTYDGVGGTAEIRVFTGAQLFAPSSGFTSNATISGLATGLIVCRGMFGPGVANFTGNLDYDQSYVQQSDWIGPRNGPVALLNRPPKFRAATR